MATTQPFFCSDLARSENDQLFGTVKRTRVYIALEYAGAWDKKAIKSEFLPDEVRQFFSSVRAQNPEIRLLLIRQDGSKDRNPACFIVIPRNSSSTAYRWELADYRDVLTLDVSQLLAGEITLPRETEPIFLVCTHGKHDKCCAKYGNPIIESSKADVGSQLWESSHVGGCRFAPNLICLPHGLVYGHLSQPEAITAINQYKQGKIFLPKFRGRANFSKPAQAAEHFVRLETGIEGIDQLELLDCSAMASDSWKTTFAVRNSRTGFAVEHTTVRSQFPHLLACSETEPQYTWSDKVSAIKPFELLPNSEAAAPTTSS